MGERRQIPGGRDVRATLDSGDADTVVVACPPHPQMGGDRRDSRLRAVSDALGDRGVACLRIDYGPWDAGDGEVTDARDALAWARDHHETVALSGYSFGGAVALRAGAAESEAGTGPVALSVLAPAATLGEESVVGAVDALSCPLQVVYGTRDDTVDATAVADRASERGHAVETLPADHFLVGHRNTAAEAAARFLAEST